MECLDFLLNLCCFLSPSSTGDWLCITAAIPICHCSPPFPPSFDSSRQPVWRAALKHDSAVSPASARTTDPFCRVWPYRPPGKAPRFSFLNLKTATRKSRLAFEPRTLRKAGETRPGIEPPNSAGYHSGETRRRRGMFACTLVASVQYSATSSFFSEMPPHGQDDDGMNKRLQNLWAF